MSTKETTIRDALVQGVWADYWAMEEEEKGASFSGCNLIDVAPKAPKWALKWAKDLAAQIRHLNGGATLEQLYGFACDMGYPNDAEHFGYHLGMQSVGHGVSWTDDIKGRPTEELIKLPRTEFYR